MSASCKMKMMRSLWSLTADRQSKQNKIQNRNQALLLPRMPSKLDLGIDVWESPALHLPLAKGDANPERHLRLRL